MDALGAQPISATTAIERVDPSRRRATDVARALANEGTRMGAGSIPDGSGSRVKIQTPTSPPIGETMTTPWTSGRARIAGGRVATLGSEALIGWIVIELAVTSAIPAIASVAGLAFAH